MRLRPPAVRLLACAAAAVSAASLLGASSDGSDPTPVTAGIYRGAGIAVRYDVSPPLRSMRPRPVKLPAGPRTEDLMTGFERPAGPQSPDTILQTNVGEGGIPAPIVSFDGPSNLAGVLPPDPVGDVGPNHYVAMSNLYFAVYDKTGGVEFGPVANNTLWAGFGGPCQAENAGDPIVLYDQLADRWILTQFTSAGPTYYNCVAISTTGDPTGTYYRYAFSTGNNFPDYPKYGVWNDAYYISTREFLNGATFAGVGAYALNRDQMIAGNPAAQVISFLVPPGGTVYNIGDGLLPADLDGAAIPPPGSPMYYVGSMDLGGPYGAPQDALTLWKFDVDFAVPPNSTFALAHTLPVAAFDSIFPCTPSARNCIPQPGTAVKLDILSYRQRVMHRLAYRNFGTHESLVANQSVEAGAGIAGLRWYEIREPNGTPPTVFQQGTYAPGLTDGIHRWMGSIAMDSAGDIALGYSASDAATTFPSVWYTGRLAGDPLGTLPQGEGAIVHGSGSQTSNAARWGDYSSLNVDPVDDCTFWYVNQYLPATSAAGWRLRVGSFKFPGCVAGPSGTLQGQVTVCGSGLPLEGATVSAGGFGATTDAAGNYAFGLPPGDYAATVKKVGYGSGSGPGPVTITDGGTTTFDTCLQGVPLIASAGATLVAENCGSPNGRIDPDETVTINFCLRNVGGADTTNLLGDLEETGGVGDAPAPVEFGIVIAGGPDACVDVTFTADEALVCGFEVTPTLELEDGPADLGTMPYGPFPTGNGLLTGSQNFDGAADPALPAGWTTSGSGNLWITIDINPDTPPIAAYTENPAVVSDKRLDSPSFAIATPAATLSFRNFFDLEHEPTNPNLGYDGGVLEIAIGAGAFQDILAAGGSFVTGGYVRTISSDFSNPLGGRQAWSGSSGGYVTTVVELPAAAAGQNVVFRWRMGSDTTIADAGWRIDGVFVFGASTCCTPIAEALAVDAVPDALEAPSAAQNGVWEPGETVAVEPSYFNGDSAGLPLTGVLTNLTGPAGPSYAISDNGADYGSIASNTDASCLATADCYAVSVDDPVVRPLVHWDATADELLSSGGTKSWTLHIGQSFTDVPDSHNFYAFIETIFHNGVTGGCGANVYCPGNAALRKQMAVFLLKARYGLTYVPPPAVGIFADVPPADPFAHWIEDLYNRGITSGCSTVPLNYCPNASVLRQQMAVFLLKTLEGASYTPPYCEGIFDDVPCPGNLFADWIEELADREITGGCGGDNFCPASPNTRGQMAVFLTKTFGLQLYAP